MGFSPQESILATRFKALHFRVKSHGSISIHSRLYIFSIFLTMQLEHNKSRAVLDFPKLKKGSTHPSAAGSILCKCGPARLRSNCKWSKSRTSGPLKNPHSVVGEVRLNMVANRKVGSRTSPIYRSPQLSIEKHGWIDNARRKTKNPSDP